MPATLIFDATGERLPIEGAVAVTLQDNDVLKPQSVQTSYSTELRFADAAAVHRVLEHAAFSTSATQLPYAEIPATLEHNGVELQPRGRLLLEQHETDEGYRGRVYAGNWDIFAVLEGKKLRELDLTRYAHDWTLPNVVAGAAHNGWRQGYVYDLYDNGKHAPAEGETVDIFEAELFPSVYARAVWEQIFTDAGRTWAGTLPAQFDALLLPTVNPAGYGEDYRRARQLLAGVSGPRVEGGQSTDRRDVVGIVPYGNVDPARGYVVPTEPGVYDAARYTWTADRACYVNVTALLPVLLKGSYGTTASAKLAIRKNGTVILNGDKQESQRFKDTWVVPQVQAQGIFLAAGDVLDIEGRLSGEKAGTVLLPGGVPVPVTRWGFEWNHVTASWDSAGNPVPRAYLKIEVLADFPPEGQIRPQDWLPDLTQTEFVKAVMGLYGLTMQSNPYTGAVRFTPTASVLARQAAAPAWDARLDASQRTQRQWAFEGLSRTNYFRWKDDATNPDGARHTDTQALGLGDGQLACLGPALSVAQDWLTLPFAATAPGRNGLLLVPRYKLVLDPTVIEQRYDKQAPQPRLVQLTSRTRTVTLQAGPQRVADVPVRLASFAEPAGPDLDFTRTLLPTYYPHLASILRQPLQLRVFVRLLAAEVAAFDQLEPVWLESQGAYFWVNRIEQYQEGAPSVAVVLLRLNS